MCSDNQKELVSQTARNGFNSYFCDLFLPRVSVDVASQCSFLKAEFLFLCASLCAHILVINIEWREAQSLSWISMGLLLHSMSNSQDLLLCIMYIDAMEIRLFCNAYIFIIYL